MIEDYGEFFSVFKGLPLDELIIIPERYCEGIDDGSLYIKYYHRFEDESVREIYISLQSPEYMEDNGIKLTESEKENFIQCISNPQNQNVIFTNYNALRRMYNLEPIDKIDFPDYSSLETE